MLNKFVNSYKKFPVQLKASFWFLISAFFQKGVSFITTPIFTRLLSTTEYGQYNVFISWSGILSIIITLNLFCGVYTSGLVKFDNRRSEFSSALQGLTLTLILIWGTIYILSASFWNELFRLNTFQMFLMFSMIWTGVVFSFWSMEQRVDFKYYKLVCITIVVSIAKPAVSIILILISKDKVTARIFALTFVELTCYIWLFFAQMQRGKKFFSKEIWKYALTFNIPLIPHYLSTFVLSSSDRIMIGRMVSDSAAGIYSLAYSISMIMTMFNTALLQTIEPWLYKKIKDEKIEDISRVAYPAFILIAFVNIILIALAPEVIRIFAPPEYYEAIYVIPPVAMGVFFMFSYTFFAVFEFYYGKTKQIAIATMAGALLNIILNYIFIQLYGYIAAGYTTLICYIIYVVFHYAFMKNICQKELNNIQPYDHRLYLGIVISFMALGFVFLINYKFTPIRYGILSVLTFVPFVKRKGIIAIAKNLMSLQKKKNRINRTNNQVIVHGY